MRVSHVILRVADMQASVAFYRDRVGLPVLMESAAFTFLDGGTIRIALNASPDSPEDTSLTELVMEVDDVRAAHADLSGRGVDFALEPRVVTSDGSRSLLAAHFRDPDAHLVSITGWSED